jgi:hypothetical protein
MIATIAIDGKLVTIRQFAKIHNNVKTVIVRKLASKLHAVNRAVLFTLKDGTTLQFGMIRATGSFQLDPELAGRTDIADYAVPPVLAHVPFRFIARNARIAVIVVIVTEHIILRNLTTAIVTPSVPFVITRLAHTIAMFGRARIIGS